MLTAAGATPQGQAAVAGDQITFTPNPDFFGAATFNYTLQDARRSVEREGTGQVTVNVIGRPLPPGAPSAVADNATAVVTWSPAEGNGAGVDGYEVAGRRPDLSTGGSTTATFSGLTNGVPVPVHGPGAQRRRLERVERAVAGRHARRRARPAGRADGAVRQRAARR